MMTWEAGITGIYWSPSGHLIESLIGLARYVYQNRYGITMSKSRAAIDGLHNKRDLSDADFQLAIRMIGFRNVVVHGYLDVNRAIGSHYPEAAVSGYTANCAGSLCSCRCRACFY